MDHLQPYSDEYLVSFLQEEDSKEAFEELYNRYWKKLLYQAQYSLGCEQDAEEVVQTVFMNIWRGRRQLQLKHTFATYIASCVKYEILATLARQKKRNQLHLSLARTGPLTENDTLQKTDYEATRQQLEETVQTLPEKCQLVFRLSREQGFSEKQIADELQVSAKTVQAHLTKALKVLRTNLQHLFSVLF